VHQVSAPVSRQRVRNRAATNAAGWHGANLVDHFELDLLELIEMV
jgi:hypothetical protein